MPNHGITGGTTPADGTVTAAKLGTALQDLVPYLGLTGTDLENGSATMEIQVVDANGNALVGSWLVRTWFSGDPNGVPATAAGEFSISTGTEFEEVDADQEYVVQTEDATGKVVMLVDNNANGLVYVMAELGGQITTEGVTISGHG